MRIQRFNRMAWQASFLLCAAAMGSAVAADPPPLKRWAILAAPAVQQKGLPDLLAVALGQTKEFELVERAEIAAALKELALSAALSSATVGDRLQLGKLLRADALILLDGEEDQPLVRLVVSECHQGARLSYGDLPIAGDPPEAAVAAVVTRVTEIRDRFRSGIQHLVGLTPFATDDLVHDYDAFQDSFTRLLADALTVPPGIAVIETDEARAIGRELQLSGNDRLTRLVPLFVEGSYRVADAIAKKDVTLTVQLRIFRSGQPPKLLQQEGLSFAAAAAYIREDAANAVLRELAVAPARSFSATEQFKSLAARADLFSSLGDPGHAVPLREAALLLNPDAARQRLQLVREYASAPMTQTPPGVRYVTGFRGPPRPYDPKWEAHCQRQVARLKTAYGHLAHLINQRALPGEEAAELVCNLASSAGALRAAPNQALKQLNDFEAEWLLTVYPRILDLSAHEPGGRDPALARLRLREVWCDGLLMAVGARYGSSAPKDYLALRLRVMEELLPDHRILALCSFGQRGGNYRDLYPDWDEAYVPFMRALGQSKREANRLVSRYLLFCHFGQPPYHQEPSYIENSNKEAAAILTDLEAFCRKNQVLANPNDVGVQFQMRIWLKEQIAACDAELARRQQPKPPTAAAPRPATAPEVRPTTAAGQPEAGSWLAFMRRQCGWQPRPNSRLIFTEVPVTVKQVDGTLVSSRAREFLETRDTARGLWYLKCTDALDVFWSHTSVFFMKEKGKAQEVLHYPPHGLMFRDIVQNGERLWIATYNQGLWLLDLSGKVCGKIGAEQGLPPAVNGYRMYPLAPGKTFVAGSFGWEASRRTWLAMVEWQDGRGKVNVFHEAKYGLTDEQARDPGNRAPHAQDIRLSFNPGPVYEFQHEGQEHDRLLLLPREDTRPANLGPLAINVDRLTLTALAPPAALERRKYRYLGDDGEILEAGEDLLSHLRVKGNNPNPDGMVAHDFKGVYRRVLMCDGWVHFPDENLWYRVHPQTRIVERLGAGPPWGRYFPSNHFGILNLDYMRGHFVQVAVAEPKP